MDDDTRRAVLELLASVARGACVGVVVGPDSPPTRVVEYDDLMRAIEVELANCPGTDRPVRG